MSGSDGFQVDPGLLSRVAQQIDSTGGGLFTRARDLQPSPDAGSSSAEVTNTTRLMSSAVAALAQHIGSIAESTGAARETYVSTDTTAREDLDTLLGPR